MKHPAFQFYPGDWQRDLPLQTCSLEARGLWLEMMNLMHDGTPYGHLATPAGPITLPTLAALVRAPLVIVTRAFHELDTLGVFSRTETGVVYSRRMLRDEALRTLRAANGHLGGPHGIKGREFGIRGGRPRKPPTKGGSETPQDGGIRKPPPASASASASASSEASSEAGPPPPPQGGDGFSEFWSQYPKHEAKEDAKKAWKDKHAADHLPAILANLAMRVGSEDWTKDKGKWIPLPASYLRGKRWEDEPTVTPASPPAAGSNAAWEGRTGGRQKL